MRSVRRVGWFFFRLLLLTLIYATAGFSAGVAAQANTPQALHKAAAKKTTTSHFNKPLLAAQRKASAVAARKKDAARVARVIRAAGPPPPIRKQYDGVASFYSDRQRLASGGRFNPSAMTAAHRSLPFGTRVQVVDKHSGRKVTVTINDRGPYKRGRVIDLSRAAAHAIGMGARGVTNVRVTVLEKNKSGQVANSAAILNKTAPKNLAVARVRKKLVEEAKAAPQR